MDKNKQTYDKEGVWNNIVEVLDKKKKRRILFFPLLGLVAIVLILGIGFYFSDIAKRPFEKDSIPHATAEELPGKNDIAVLDHSTLTKQETKTTLNTLNHQNESTNQQLKAKNSTRNSIRSQSLPNWQDKSHHSKANTERSTINDLSKPNDDLLPHQFEQNIGSQPKSTPPPLAKLDVLVISPLTSIQHIITYDWQMPEEEAKIDKSDISPAWSVYIFTGGSAISEDIVRSSSFFEQRSLSEMPNFQWFVEMGISRQLSKGLSIHMGIQYEQIWSVYNATSLHSESFERLTAEGTEFFFDNGSSFSSSGQVTITETTSRHIIHNNRISRFHLPFTMQLNRSVKRHGIGLGLGARLSFPGSFNGVYKDRDGLQQYIQRSASLEMPTVTFGLIGHLHYAYVIKDNIKLHLGMQLSEDVIPIGHGDKPYIRWSTFGGVIGLQYSWR